MTGKNGWIRHRGGPQPVSDETKLEIRFRDGTFRICHAGDLIWWEHEKEPKDPMAYRIIEEEKQEMAVPEMTIKVDTKEAIAAVADEVARHVANHPLTWRDRIREIDAYMIGEKEAHKRLIESAETERAELVAKLAAEGLALRGEPVKLIETVGAWRIGDLLTITQKKHGHKFRIGEVVSIGDIDSDPTEETTFKCWHADKSDFWYISHEEAEFHSRP